MKEHIPQCLFMSEPDNDFRLFLITKTKDGQIWIIISIFPITHLLISVVRTQMLSSYSMTIKIFGQQQSAAKILESCFSQYSRASAFSSSSSVPSAKLKTIVFLLEDKLANLTLRSLPAWEISQKCETSSLMV